MYLIFVLEGARKSKILCGVNGKDLDELIPTLKKGQLFWRYPGAQLVCDKVISERLFQLGRCLCKNAFDFVPETFVLPQQLRQLEKAVTYSH